MSNKEIKKYDGKGNLIYEKHSFGNEWWREYDENNNLIHEKSSSGSEYWREFDENNNLIHYKDTNGRDYWYKYNKYNKYNSRIKITEQEFKQIERRKEKQELYLNIKKSSRFEIMDI